MKKALFWKRKANNICLPYTSYRSGTMICFATTRILYMVCYILFLEREIGFHLLTVRIMSHKAFSVVPSVQFSFVVQSNIQGFLLQNKKLWRGFFVTLLKIIETRCFYTANILFCAKCLYVFCIYTFRAAFSLIIKKN